MAYLYVFLLIIVFVVLKSTVAMAFAILLIVVVCVLLYAVIASGKYSGQDEDERSITIFVAIIVAIIFISLIVAFVMPPITEKGKAEAKLEAQQEEISNERFNLELKARNTASAGERLLATMMREPESLEIDRVLVMDSGAVCYNYRARNGFGGMSGGSAVLSGDGNQLLTNDENGFNELWNKECLNGKLYLKYK